MIFINVLSKIKSIYLNLICKNYFKLISEKINNFDPIKKNSEEIIFKNQRKNSVFSIILFIRINRPKSEPFGEHMAFHGPTQITHEMPLVKQFSHLIF